MSENRKHPSLGQSEVGTSQADQDALAEISELANELTGVQLDARHKMMIFSRLNKRMKELRITSLSDYVQHFHSNRAQEAPLLIGLITTHHTFFFREFSHFEYLLNDVFPKLLPLIKSRGDGVLRVWAAACSRGQGFIVWQCFSTFI